MCETLYSQKEGPQLQIPSMEAPSPSPGDVSTTEKKALFRKPLPHPHGLLASLPLTCVGMHEHMLRGTRINFDVEISENWWNNWVEKIKTPELSI